MTLSPTIALVGCGKSKRDGTHAARDLYTGALFRGALAHAEATWGTRNVYVVSAKYGLVSLDRPIETYNETLPRSIDARMMWAARVGAALLDERPGSFIHGVVIYAGAAYAEPLKRWLHWQALERLGRVELPLTGMSQGARLAWFAEARRQRERAECTTTTSPYAR